MRKHLLRAAALFTLLSLLLTCPALAALSWDRVSSVTYDAYSWGDLAAARFAVYGLLPDRYRTPQEDTSAPLSRLDAVQLLYAAFAHEGDPAGGIPFHDVDEAHREAVSWAYSSAVAGGCSPTQFGTYPVTERAYLTMLLNALGFRWKFAYGNAVEYAQSVGLVRPVGISDTFSLGDALLYLQEVLSLSMPEGTPMRIKLNIPQDPDAIGNLNKLPFPCRLVIRPSSVEDADAQMELATRFLPERIDVDCTALSIADMKALYERFSAQTVSGGAWYISRITEESLYDSFRQLPPAFEMTDAELADFDGEKDSLKELLDGGWISDSAYQRESDALEIRLLTGGRTASFWFHYNEAWELACDLDDAFQYFADGELSRRADEFYKRYVSRARNDRDAALQAERAIVGAARYAENLDERDGSAFYFDDAHSILGLFKNGEIVCDGYAKLFQYLMIRAGVPCVVVSGSTRSAKQAEQGKIDHAWNKVFVNGKWLNMDVCWADTGWGSTFDLRGDEAMPKLSHWPVTHTVLQ